LISILYYDNIIEIIKVPERKTISELEKLSKLS